MGEHIVEVTFSDFTAVDKREWRELLSPGEYAPNVTGDMPPLGASFWRGQVDPSGVWPSTEVAGEVWR